VFFFFFFFGYFAFILHNLDPRGNAG